MFVAVAFFKMSDTSMSDQELGGDTSDSGPGFVSRKRRRQAPDAPAHPAKGIISMGAAGSNQSPVPKLSDAELCGDSTSDSESECAAKATQDASHSTTPASLTPFDQACWILRQLGTGGKLSRIAVGRETTRKLRVASFCTGLGTDLIASDALSAAWSYLQDDLGLDASLEFSRVMVCEITPWKRDRLLRAFPEVGVVFGDVSTLKGRSEFCYKGGGGGGGGGCVCRLSDARREFPVFGGLSDLFFNVDPHTPCVVSRLPT